MHGLGCRDGRIRVAHGGHGDEATFEDQRGFDAEKGGLPDHQVGPFADFDAAHFVADAVGDGRVDGVFGDVTFDAEVVVACVVFAPACRAAASSCAPSARCG